ncbi:MAG: IS630 family transposase [Ardenticatenaceae bacterium]|nr:IS630 family transposase [Ardenticatenaceae bacterium]
MKRQWCLSQITGAFLARLEQILWLYAQAYDAAYPVVCLDERPCFLIGDTVEPLALQTGKVRREHYAYEKLGSCTLFAAIEPLTGKRVAQVYPQRRKIEFTSFCQALARAYPQATKIRVVLDNLNTHTTSSFYENLPAADAFALAQRFEFYFTPLSASWLNMIEIEFSALARLCLNRRIPDMGQLKKEVLAFFDERAEKRIKINWQFSLECARKKLNSRYAVVNEANSQYK